jgi:hypothetical protein
MNLLDLSPTIQVVAGVATVAAVGFAGWQIHLANKQFALSRDATKAQLLLQVDGLIQTHNPLYQRLRNKLDVDPFEVGRAMGALERLNVLVEQGLADVQLIDDLHGWRFKLLLDNPEVQRRLSARSGGWTQFRKLSQKLQEGWDREDSNAVRDPK